MKIAACYKAVPFSEEIEVRRDRTLDFSKASLEIGQYDLRAVETAMRLKEAAGEGSVVALTIGGETVSNSKMKKAILARGPAEMYGVQDDSLANADTYVTASCLRAAVEKMGDIDLVVCGEGSSDMYVQQVGNVLGAMLGWTTVNGVSAVTQIEGGLRIERVVSDGVEVLECALPAVITVAADINIPRIATMKDILAAGKKPATVWSLSDIGISPTVLSETESVLAPKKTERRREIFEGNTDDVLDAFAEALKKVL